MAYISIDEVKAVREQLKKEFPEFRFSVRRRDAMAIDVSVMKGPTDFSDLGLRAGYSPINEHTIDKYPHAEFLGRVIEIMKKAPGTVEGGQEYYNNSDVMSDYFDYAYFMDLSIGKWNKPYKRI